MLLYLQEEQAKSMQHLKEQDDAKKPLKNWGFSLSGRRRWRNNDLVIEWVNGINELTIMCRATCLPIYLSMSWAIVHMLYIAYFNQHSKAKISCTIILLWLVYNSLSLILKQPWHIVHYNILAVRKDSTELLNNLNYRNQFAQNLWFCCARGFLSLIYLLFSHTV